MSVPVGGSFLDFVSGSARETVAIEPSRTFRDALKTRGYRVFPYVQDALAEHRGKVDVATCFSVLEHIEDPVIFLREIRELLADDGVLHLSTPNAGDALLEAMPQEYPRFFYRSAHLWYFDQQSLRNLLEICGFKDVSVRYFQRFGLANALGWMIDRRPSGESTKSFVTPAMDAAWRSELERSGRADYMFVSARA